LLDKKKVRSPNAPNEERRGRGKEEMFFFPYGHPSEGSKLLNRGVEEVKKKKPTLTPNTKGASHYWKTV